MDRKFFNILHQCIDVSKHHQKNKARKQMMTLMYRFLQLYLLDQLQEADDKLPFYQFMTAKPKP